MQLGLFDDVSRAPYTYYYYMQVFVQIMILRRTCDKPSFGTMMVQFTDTCMQMILVLLLPKYDQCKSYNTHHLNKETNTAY